MPAPGIHRFERDGRRFAIDPETCFCFECDAISWDVLELYPHTPVNRIYHLLQDRYPLKELGEVIGELEWLRATKSILVRNAPQDFDKPYRIERGLNRITIAFSGNGTAVRETKRSWRGKAAAVITAPAHAGAARDAVALLLNRSEQQKELTAIFLTDASLPEPRLIADLCNDALRAARLAGKQLTAAVRVDNVAVKTPPAALEGHYLSLQLECSGADPDEVHAAVQALAGSGLDHLGRIAKAFQTRSGIRGRIIVRPGHPKFGGVAEALFDAGFGFIELDLDGAYIANPSLSPESMLDGLREAARFYATSLLNNKYFRLDPVAQLFWRIYDGQPLRRNDPAGVHELASDSEGRLYPSARFIGNAAFQVGSLPDGLLDETALSAYDNVGALTTAACRRCWARNLCGGGTAAVHHALTGSFRTPDEAWCEAQRTWLTEAVSAFNILSARNINFSRVYQQITPGGRPSIFQLVRAALRMTVALRPIEETDAAMLVQWENWAEAAYFIANEKGLLLATQYDREMDSLHPVGVDQELICTRKDGKPIGLFKIRPESIPGVARAFLYLRDPADYAAADIRKGFRTLLDQAGAQQGLRRLTTPALDTESGLQEFLKATGFTPEGIQREAVYLHGQYRDLHWYGLTPGA